MLGRMYPTLLSARRHPLSRRERVRVRAKMPLPATTTELSVVGYQFSVFEAQELTTEN